MAFGLQFTHRRDGVHSAACAAPHGDPVLQLGAQAPIMHRAGRPHLPSRLHDHILGGVGYVSEHPLGVASGPEAVAMANTLELHPCHAHGVPVGQDHPKRPGDPCGADVVLHDLQCLLQRHQQARFQSEGRPEADLVEKGLAQPSQVGVRQPGGGVFKELPCDGSGHVPLLHQASQLDEGPGIETTIAQRRVDADTQLLDGLIEFIGLPIGMYAAVSPASQIPASKISPITVGHPVTSDVIIPFVGQSTIPGRSSTMHPLIFMQDQGINGLDPHSSALAHQLPGCTLGCNTGAFRAVQDGPCMPSGLH